MSNSLAIATVSATIRYLLDDALQNDPDDGIDGAVISIVAPGTLGSSNLPEGTRAILFLARITPSAAWRSMDAPTRDARGNLIQKPRVALNLHYLIALRGDEATYENHRVAGIIARTLAVKPILSRGLITLAIGSVTDPANPLRKSNLAQADEPIRITPETVNTDELSKIWTAYPQASLGPWLAYEVTPVILDTEDAAGPALPVLERNIYVSAISQARITRVSPSGSPEDPIIAGDELLITGTNLASGGSVEVVFDGEPAGVAPNESSGNAVKVDLPADLHAGMHGLRVVGTRMIGTASRRVSESNFFPFTLTPTFYQPIVKTGMTSKTVKTVTVWAGTLTVTCNLAVGTDQTFEILLNCIGDATRSYAFTAPKRPGDTPTMSVSASVHGVPSGTYLVRIRVDGATSPLIGNTTSGFTGPTLVF